MPIKKQGKPNLNKADNITKCIASFGAIISETISIIANRNTATTTDLVNDRTITGSAFTIKSKKT